MQFSLDLSKLEIHKVFKVIKYKIFNDMPSLDVIDLKYIGKGGYGEVFEFNNLIFKFINPKGKYYSERFMIQKKMLGEGEKKITNDEHKEAFINDVFNEAENQNTVFTNVKSIDGSPITSKIYCSIVYIDDSDDYIGLIIMDKINGISVKKIDSTKTKHFIESIIKQLTNFSEQMIKLGIIHNDTASDNILIQNFDSENPIIKIIDWGQSCTLDEEKYFYSEKKWSKIPFPDYITKRTISELESKLYDDRGINKILTSFFNIRIKW